MHNAILSALLNAGMAGKLKILFFEPYFRKLEIAAFRRDAEHCGRLARQMLEGVALEQQPRLRMIRERGPGTTPRAFCMLATRWYIQTSLKLVEERRQMESVGAYEAKTHLPGLLKRVARGEHITITRHGQPVAQLVPVAATMAEPDEKIRALRESRRGGTLGELELRDMIEDGRSL